MIVSYYFELKHLVSVTKHLYQILYLDFLKNVEVKTESNLFLKSFKHAINALKIRRGFMLPIGADAETCYREQEVWTYAIFTASLLKESNLTNFEELLPKQGFEWLKEYPQLFSSWHNFLTDKPEDGSVFSMVIQQAQKSVNLDLPTLPQGL